MSVIVTTSAATALQQPFMRQAWVMPDNSLVIVINTGSVLFGGANTNHTIVLQSTNWQTGSPTWTFVKQITATSNLLASSWWDGARLHIAYAGAGAGSTTGLFYISASYSGSTWTWDSGTTTLLAASDATNNASAPSIIVDSNGVIYVAYRNQAISGAVNSVCMFTKSVSGWNSAPVQMSNTTGSSGTFYGALAYGNATVVLVTVEGASYYAQAHPDSGSWGTIVSGPTSQVGTGQQYGPVSVIADGNSGVWVGISSTTGLKVQYLSFVGNAITWRQGNVVIDASNNVSAPEWLYCNGVLYGYYFKLTSANNADVYAVQYNPIANVWAASTNLTNAAASNNVNPIVPKNYVYGGAVTVMPIVYESGTASPFNLNLITQVPLALSRSLDFMARVGITNTSMYKDFKARVNVGPAHDFMARVNLQPATVATDSLPNGMFGMTYGLRSQTDTLDIRVPITARALGMTWFRIQQSIGNIWLTQGDLPGSPNNLNWAPVDQAVGLLNQFGIHVVFPLRAVSGTPAWMFTNTTQQRSTSADGTGNDFAPDPTNMALFAAACAYRYDGIHGPNGPNGMPLKIDSFEVGNEEYNQKNSNRIVDSHGNPTAATVYGLYNSPLSTYNAIAPTMVGNGGLPPQPRRDPHFFVQVLKAVQPAIKAVYPGALIGSAALWWMHPANFTDFVKGSYLEGVKGLLSYWGFHLYTNFIDPATGTSTTASITTAINNMQAQIVASGDNIPLWLGEFGWGTTDQGNGLDCDESTQAARYATVINACITSGVVAKIFPYDITYRTPSETSSLVQYIPSVNVYRKLPAYYTLQGLIKQHTTPTGGSFALFPATSRRVGTFPATKRRTGTFPATSRRKSL